MKIHPTAIVSPNAHLGENVEVGPGALIGDGVVIGAGCVIQAHAVIEGDTTLGEGNTVGYGAVIGAPPQDYAHSPEIKSSVVIGHNNRIREYVTIHRGTKEGSATHVGDRCFLMVGCHLGHNVQVGNDVVIVNNCLLGGYVQVGDGAVLGGGAVFHQFVRIGKRAMVAGGSQFNKDIPPFAMAQLFNLLSGVNIIGLRRAGFHAATRTEIRHAFKLVFRSNLPVKAALDSARESVWGPEAQEFFDFIAASKRGCSTCNLAKGQVIPLEDIVE
ncbi:MAG: acyl-ACP--UDP-N-acetylglucosamine O-acyltransferase [bacterium]